MNFYSVVMFTGALNVVYLDFFLDILEEAESKTHLYRELAYLHMTYMSLLQKVLDGGGCGGGFKKGHTSLLHPEMGYLWFI